MKKFSIGAVAAAVAALAISGVYAVHSTIDQSSAPVPRVLLICGATGDECQRTLVGARAAAKEYGVELRAETPAPEQTTEEQTELVRNIRPADFDGVAIAPEDPASQVNMINELAHRTKVVTLGNDCENSKRLCHIGLRQSSAGAKAASAALEEWTHQGKVVLVSTAISAGQGEMIRERLNGFQEKWDEDAHRAALYPVVAISMDGEDRLSEMLADSKPALIVTLDSEATESVIKATAAWPESNRLPIVAIDSSDMVLAAIEDGRVSSAVFNDTYDDGYEAIRRLAIYNRGDDTALPLAGCGNIWRGGEIIRKSNVADIRRRMSDPAKDCSATPQLHLSAANFNASLLAR